MMQFKFFQLYNMSILIKQSFILIIMVVILSGLVSRAMVTASALDADAYGSMEFEDDEDDDIPLHDGGESSDIDGSKMWMMPQQQYQQQQQQQQPQPSQKQCEVGNFYRGEDFFSGYALKSKFSFKITIYNLKRIFFIFEQNPLSSLSTATRIHLWHRKSIVSQP